jgi:hypothetical protein
MAQRFFRWWLATFLAVTFVQVLQAGCLGLGAALVASPLVSGNYEGPLQGMMSGVLGVGAIVAAISLPSMLLGSLARANFAPGVLSSAVNAASLLSGFGALRGLGAAATVAAVAPRASIYPVAPALTAAAPAALGAAGAGSGYVYSLLSGAPPRLALPPPRPLGP